jgi:hypothetical protein
MKEKLLKAWDWLVWSSADPSKVSLTVKGFLLGIGGFVVFATGIPAEVFAENVVAAIEAIFAVVAAGITAYGAIRKVVLTLRRK